MITFSADEIFEIAEQIERNGAKFYRKAAESAEGDNRSLLLRLAKMEDDHEKIFATMRAEFAKAGGEPDVFDPDDQAALYLQAVADGKIFGSDPSENLTGEESIKDILTIALGLEKDSVIFYRSMMGTMSKVVTAMGLEGIIQEEVGHILDLNQKMKAL